MAINCIRDELLYALAAPGIGLSHCCSIPFLACFWQHSMRHATIIHTTACNAPHRNNAFELLLLYLTRTSHLLSLTHSGCCELLHRVLAPRFLLVVLLLVGAVGGGCCCRRGAAVVVLPRQRVCTSVSSSFAYY